MGIAYRLLCTLTVSGLLLCPIGCAANLVLIRRESLRDFRCTQELARWSPGHVGIIFYPDGARPFFEWNELIELARSLGVKSVKTWLKGYKPGEMAEKLSTPEYKRILTEFDTVLFDVCPDFVLRQPYDDAMSKTIRAEYEGVAHHLASHYRSKNKTFLLTLFMENNLYFGTRRSHYPDFPVERFYADATAGVNGGIRRARGEMLRQAQHDGRGGQHDGRGGQRDQTPRIYTVIEVAGLAKDFIARYLPKSRADLYAISYYGSGELGKPDFTLPECIEAVSKAVPHDGPFGKHNIILGELGRCVFWGGSYGEDREQIGYLQTTLDEARAANVQYAFIFWLTDQERHPNDGWGFVSSKQTGGKLRRAWHAFQRLFEGKTPAGRAAKPHPAIDAVRVLDPNPEPGRAARVQIDVANRSAWNEPATPARNLTVELKAGSQAMTTTLSLAADETATLQGVLTATEDAGVTATVSGAGIDPVVRTFSLNVADIVVERIYTDPVSPKAGGDVRLFAVVRNAGKAPITDFSVVFHVDDFKDYWVTWGCIYGETLLKPGQSLPIGGGFLWKATPGKHKIRAWANPDGSRESDYSNNIRYEMVTIPD